MWPLDPTRFLRTPMHLNEDALTGILSPAELVTQYEKKREDAHRGILGEEVTLTRNGFIDTKRGAVLTSDKAFELVKRKAQAEAQRREIEHAAALQRNKRDARRREKRLRKNAVLHELVMQRRAALSGMPVNA